MPADFCVFVHKSIKCTVVFQDQLFLYNCTQLYSWAGQGLTGQGNTGIAVLRHLRKEQQTGERSMMDTDQDRIDGEKVARLLQDGLLNRVNEINTVNKTNHEFKVYEVQCEREKQFNLISQMMKMSVSPFKPEDKTNTSPKQQEMEVSFNQIAKIFWSIIILSFK